MCSALPHEFGVACDDPGLRSAEKLVAREHHEAGPAVEGLAVAGCRPASRADRPSHGHHVEQARADVSDERGVESGELGRPRLGETDDRVVRLVDPQHDGDIVVRVVDGAAKCRRVRLVADLDEVEADRAITSGIRKPPPISTSLPR